MPTNLPTYLQRIPCKAPPSDNRDSASKRGYGRRWRRLRLMVLRRQPMCQWPGCFEAATDVDHIVSKRDGGDDSFENLQALCHAPHSQKTTQGGTLNLYRSTDVDRAVNHAQKLTGFQQKVTPDG